MDVKKGKRTWKPADALRVRPGSVTDGYKPRWVTKDSMNIEKKLAEGWRFSKKEQESGEHGSLTSTTEHRELVLMEMHEDDIAARTEYFQSKTDRQTAALKKDAEHATEQALDGKIIIE